VHGVALVESSDDDIDPDMDGVPVAPSCGTDARTVPQAREEEQMVWTSRATAAGLVVAIALMAGCQTTGGRTTGDVLSDAAITGKVKAALVATDIETLTRVDVDTVNGTVYLSGAVDGASTKVRAEQVARDTEGVRQVVNNLSVTGAATSTEPAPARFEGAR
jgi:hyperosmotically inducible protein